MFRSFLYVLRLSLVSVGFRTCFVAFCMFSGCSYVFVIVFVSVHKLFVAFRSCFDDVRRFPLSCCKLFVAFRCCFEDVRRFSYSTFP